MYYSNSSVAKPTIDSWYESNIFDKEYDSYVATSVFCEQAKVIYSSDSAIYESGKATMESHISYIPNFKCYTDAYNKGEKSLKAGMLTYDEIVHAGGHFGEVNANSNFFLYNGDYHIWTMSSNGCYKYSGSCYPSVWGLHSNGNLANATIYRSDTPDIGLRPVINLKSDVLATGTGTSSDPYVIVTK